MNKALELSNALNGLPQHEALEAMSEAVLIGQFLAFAQQNGVWMCKLEIGELPTATTIDDLRDLRIAFVKKLHNITPNAEVTGRPLADGPVDRRVRRHGG